MVLMAHGHGIASHSCLWSRSSDFQCCVQKHFLSRRDISILVNGSRTVYPAGFLVIPPRGMLMLA